MILKIFSDRQWKEFKEIYCWSLKQRFGMMILYMALLFMALPMILLLVISNASQQFALGNNSWAMSQFVGNHFSSALKVLLPVLVVPLTLLFVLILSVMLYNYMHQKRSVDYFHSLPAGRTPLLLGKYFAGLTMIFVPLMVNFGIVAIIIGANNLGATTPVISILYDLLWAMLMVTAAFSFTVLMAVCSGTTMDMVISTVVINISYPILIMLCQLLATSILPGLNLGSNFLSVYAFAFAPFAAAFMPFLPAGYSGNTMGTSFTVWWILLTLVLFAACIALYRKRKSESAENTFAFPLPKIMIRFVATAAVGLGLGLIFVSVTGNNNQFSFLLGVAAGSLITHIIAEAIYSRGFKGLKKSFVYYGAFVVLFLAAYLSLSFGFFGYDTRIPATADVASVSLDSTYYYYLSNYNGAIKVLDENGNVISTIEGKLTSSENIDMVRTIQQSIIDIYKQNGYPYKPNTTHYGPMRMTYHLKNGHTMTRYYDSYEFNSTSKIPELSQKIENSKEYKTSSNLIYYLEPAYISNVQFVSNDKIGSNLEPNKSISGELIDALKQDVDAEIITENQDNTNAIHLNIGFVNGFAPAEGSPLKKLIGNYSGKVYFSIRSNEQSADLSIPKSYVHTMALIEKYGWIK